MLKLWRAWQGWRAFERLPSARRELVFYIEDVASYSYFSDIVDELKKDPTLGLVLLTSAPNDPLLALHDPRLPVFFIGDGIVRTALFSSIDCDVMVLTMPDLGIFHLQRSLHPVHYAYIFHSIVSTQMIYRTGAFDHYDSIYCVGPHHAYEIRAWEAARQLKPKQLVEHGYGRLDQMLERAQQVAPVTDGPPCILVAPSWGPSGLLELQAFPLVQALLAAGFRVALRPHPMTCKAHPQLLDELREKFGANPHFSIDANIAAWDSYAAAQLMISDWSGAAFEFAFGFEKPLLFIDVPRKINNSDYQLVDRGPIEVDLREALGAVLPLDELGRLPELILELLGQAEHGRRRLAQLREETVFNVGSSARAAATALVKTLEQRRAQRVR